MSQFLWVRSLGAAQLSPLVQCLSQGSNYAIRGAAIISRLEQSRALFPVTSIVVGRIGFLAGCWTEGLSYSPAVGSSLYGSFLYQNEQVKRARARESTSKTEVTIFYNLISEVTFHYFSRILLIISKSLQPTLKERGLHMSKKWQGSLRPILEAPELELPKDA